MERVFKVQDGSLEFHIFEHVSANGKVGGTFGARESDVEIERTDAPKAAPKNLDWRKLPLEHRTELYSELNLKRSFYGH